MKGPRLSHQGLRILGVFLDSPGERRSGVDVMKATGLPSGTLYPILLRFERFGLLSSQWEETAAAELGRPRRREYELTALGTRTARQAFAELERWQPARAAGAEA
jgi:PadR family transcriptional regulator, regulatory protein PadR